jgi:hypothetical protein
MAKLLAIGTRYDRMRTVSGITSTTDGYQWSAPDDIVTPFDIRQSGGCITANPNRHNFIISAMSDDGRTASSTDGVSFVNGSIIDGNLSPRSVCYATDNTGANGIFMMVGNQKYANTEVSHTSMDEVPQIFTSMNGLADSWLMVYSHDTNKGIFHGVRRFDDMWVACGQADGNPLLVYSLDNGFTWDPVTLPALFNGISLFDITQANGLFYITAYSVIVYTPSLVNPVWNATDFITTAVAKPDFKKIASNPDGEMVAVSSGTIYFSSTGGAWIPHTEPGYQFTSVIWFNNHWIVGCYSLLTQYTYFTSPDGKKWTGQNNNMHMYDFTVI